MFPKVFADSLPLNEKGYDSSAYVLIGVPFDGTSTFRKGTKHGPSALREASYNFESFLPDLGIDLSDLSIFDAGDIDEAHTVDDLMAIVKIELEDLFSKHDLTSLFPVFLGGEHSLTPIVLQHIVPKLKDLQKKVGVVYLDAHLDMRDEYHYHGYSHACAARRVSEIVGMENIILMGVRSWSQEEAEFIEQYISTDEFIFYQPRDLLDSEPQSKVKMVVDRLLSNGCNRIYLSIDMDVFDPSEAPGVGNPEPGGLRYSQVMEMVKSIAPHLCGLDLVEVNPLYDHGITALLGAKMVREIIGMHFAHISQSDSSE